MLPIFAYGTLRSQEVRQALLNKSLAHVEGVHAVGFSIHPVLHGSYPAVVKSEIPQAFVVGTLLYDVSPEDITFLDPFEDEYVRETVQIHNNADGSIVTAQLYVWNKDRSLLDESRVWSYEEDFVKQEERRKAFVASTAAFREQLLSRT